MQKLENQRVEWQRELERLGREENALGDDAEEERAVLLDKIEALKDKIRSYARIIVEYNAAQEKLKRLEIQFEYAKNDEERSQVLQEKILALTEVTHLRGEIKNLGGYPETKK